MAVQRFYGPVNSQSKEAIQIYGATKTLTGGGGSVDSTGVGNVIAFYAQTFYALLTGGLTGYEDVLESSRTLLGISVTAGASSYTASLLFTDGTSKDILASGSTTLTNQDLYSWGISVPPTPTTTGDDTIILTPTYSSYHTNEIIKMYGSVNGVTKLCYLKMLGRVVYYTDSGNTQTATVRIYSNNDVNQLCHSGDSWNATIDGVTIANTKIKEVHLYNGVTQINLGFCYGCTELTDVTLPSTVTYIGQHFLDNCHKFNSPLNLSNVEFIGGYFMHECDDFNQPLYIPSSVQTIGDYFMYRCNSMIEPITVDCPATVITSDTHTLSTLVASVPGYRTGHTLNGTYAQDWVAKFPNRSVVPYRKLFVDAENEWGEVYYYSLTKNSYTVVTSDSTVTITSVDPDQLETFITNNNINTSVAITINKSIFSRGWIFTKMDSSTVRVTVNNLLTETGINASFTGSTGTATANFQAVTVPDKTSAIVSAKVTSASDFATLFGTYNSAPQPQINGVSINPAAVQGYHFGGLERFDSSAGSSQYYFLAMCENLEWVNMVSYNGVYIPDYFLYKCPALIDFTGIPEGVTSIGFHFMGYCTSFNQPVTFPSTMTGTGEYFLEYCSSFNQEVTLPEGLQSVDAFFLYNCTSFNQPVTFPSTLTSIGSGFLSGCSSFDQPVTIPTTITAINNDFLRSTKFNQPLTIPSNITRIGNFFLSGTKFNQPLTIPSSVTSIGTYFLNSCSSFNSALTLSPSITAIDNYFLNQCSVFNQTLTIPSSVTTIGNYFMRQCNAFNQVLTIPDHVTSIGDNFMYNCRVFNQALVIPSSVATIGKYFLYLCIAFNQDITIPSTLTSIGVGILNCCNAMVGTITVNAPATITDDSDATFSNSSSASDQYTTGMKLSGTYKNEWHTKFPDISKTLAYRKTIVV